MIVGITSAIFCITVNGSLIIEQPFIESLNLKKSLNQSLQPLEATDIDGFIKNQYQNTIITAIEDAKNQVYIN